MATAPKQGDSISGLFNENGKIELQTKQTLIKAFRSALGQYKVLADTTVNASTVLVTEAEFAFPVKKGIPYEVTADLLISTGATPGIKVYIAAPAQTSGVVFRGEAFAQNASTANIAPVVLADGTHLNAALYSSAAAYSRIHVRGLLIPNVDDVVTIQFAQNTSDASDTILLRGSTMNVLNLGGGGKRKSPSVV
jgi:hypothetical protein